jgi:protocatechuate 3,4-dioxygenase beta subunit
MLHNRDVRLFNLSGWIARGARALLVACQATADNIRGPLYRRGAPWRTRLCSVDEPGEPLSITGTVTASEDCQLGLEDPSHPGTYNLRGRTQSGDEGDYQFQSIVPGRYPLFWPLTRPRHIHVIVTHPQYEPLTTQIYLEGDEYNRSDPWWQESLTIRLQQHVDPKSNRVECRGVFDIALKPKAS